MSTAKTINNCQQFLLEKLFWEAIRCKAAMGRVFNPFTKPFFFPILPQSTQMALSLYCLRSILILVNMHLKWGGGFEYWKMADRQKHLYCLLLFHFQLPPPNVAFPAQKGT